MISLTCKRLLLKEPFEKQRNTLIMSHIFALGISNRKFFKISTWSIYELGRLTLSFSNRPAERVF